MIYYFYKNNEKMNELSSVIQKWNDYCLKRDQIFVKTNQEFVTLKSLIFKNENLSLSSNFFVKMESTSGINIKTEFLFQNGEMSSDTVFLQFQTFLFELKDSTDCWNKETLKLIDQGLFYYTFLAEKSNVEAPNGIDNIYKRWKRQLSIFSDTDEKIIKNIDYCYLLSLATQLAAKISYWRQIIDTNNMIIGISNIEQAQFELRKLNETPICV